MLVGGIDVGTQSVKVLIYDSSEKEITEAYITDKLSWKTVK